jgi:hypothetical protein
MEAPGSSETSVNVYQTARHHIPYGSDRSHCRKDQKSLKEELVGKKLVLKVIST